MPGKIFISYRREDTAANALGIGQYLEHEFGRKNVFIDVDMRAGTKFTSVLEKRLSECKVMLVLIGPGWLNAQDDQCQRRLDNSEDWVRVEIAHALKRNITVIPALVNRAELPRKATLPDDIQGLLDHQAVSVTTTGFRNEMAGLVKDIRSIPSPWPWRRFGAIAAGLLLLLLAASVLAQPSRFVNAVERIRLSLFPQRSESATQNGIWSGQAGEWVLYGYTDKWIGYFFQPSSVKTFADDAVYTARFPLRSTNTTMPSEKTLPQPAYEDDRTVLDCKKSLAMVAERTVYNQSGEIISHLKFGDPESLDLSTGGPINAGSILATAQSIMCDKQLRTPLLSKQQISETTLSYLSPTPNGVGDIFYGPAKPVPNMDYQFELLTVLKWHDDHALSEASSGNNVLGLQSSYRSLAQRLQMYCRDRKVQAPRMEYYDAEDNLVSIVVPNPLRPMDVIANSLFDSLLKIACGANVGGTYEGMNNTKYENGGQGEQKISITVKQIGSAVNVSFQTASGGQGKGDATIAGVEVKSMRLQSTTPECPGTYDASLQFSGETVSWAYKGQDCGGPMEGSGTAKRIKL